jgi:predicted Zn-dependent protease
MLLADRKYTVSGSSKYISKSFRTLTDRVELPMIARMNDSSKQNLQERTDLLERLYRAGDYKQARPAAEQLIKESELSDKDSARVKKIISSMRTDKGAIGAFAFTLLVLVYLIIKYGI